MARKKTKKEMALIVQKREATRKKNAAIKKRRETLARKKAAKEATKTGKLISMPSTAMSKRSSGKPSLPDLPVVASEGFNLAALGASRAKFTPAQREALMEDWTADDVSIRPDGIVYVEANKHRDRLTDVFGPGQWAEVALEELPRVDAGLVVQTWGLMIGGVGINQCLGECQWSSNNPMMSKGDAVEGAKSNALVRNCKPIMNQRWRDKRWAYQFRLRHGVLVHYKKGTGWRHVDDPPLDGEKGIDDRSPNQDRYRAPSASSRVAGVTRPGVSDRQQQQAEASQALTVTSTDPIDKRAIGQIAQAMETHQRTVAEVRAFLKAELGILSRKDIQKKDLKKVLDWIRAPYDIDEPPLQGEVVS